MLKNVTIPHPTLESFNITEDDCNKYSELKIKCDKWNKTLDVITKLLQMIVIISIVLYFVYPRKNMNWDYWWLLVLAAIIIYIPISLFLGTLAAGFLGFILAGFYRDEKTIIKKNKKLSDVENYLEAIENFNNPEHKKELLKNQYPDIEQFNYNINKYAEYRVMHFTERIKNSIIDLNRKNTEEW